MPRLQVEGDGKAKGEAAKSETMKPKTTSAIAELLAESAVAIRHLANVLYEVDDTATLNGSYLLSLCGRIDEALRKESVGPKRKAKR